MLQHKAAILAQGNIAATFLFSFYCTLCTTGTLELYELYLATFYCSLIDTVVGHPPKLSFVLVLGVADACHGCDFEIYNSWEYYGNHDSYSDDFYHLSINITVTFIVI